MEQIKSIQQVKEFHDAFSVETPSEITLNKERLLLRARLIAEEAKEVIDELKMDNLSIRAIAKELADLQYVLNGTLLELGIANKFTTIFDAVHKSNMSKLDESGKPIYREDGKVLKSENYKVANLNFLIDNVG